MASKCDIILPVYNNEETVGSAIMSLLTQTIRELRVIIIDDGSAESCSGLLRCIAATDTRIILLRQSNAGIVAALNRGLSLVTAPVIARMDADDLAAPDRIERQLSCFEAHPDIVATSGMVRHIDADGEVIGVYCPLNPDRADPTRAPAIEPYLIHPFLAVRRPVLEAAGGYRYVHHAEDTDLYWRLRERGRLLNLPYILGDYRLHNNSISGGSVINGRIMAVSSQLAAISAKRRHAGLTDLAFDYAQLADYRSAGAIEAIMTIAERPLRADERSWFRIAVAAKLLELASYRPWKLDHNDLSFIRATWLGSRVGAKPTVRRDLAVLIQRATAKLILEGRFAAASALAVPSLYAGALVRTAKGAINNACQTQ